MKKTTRNLFAMGAFVLMAASFAACGGGSSSSSNVPTDGPLGEIPAVAGKYLPEINDLQQRRWKSSSEENREEIAKKEDALKAEWDQAIKAVPSIEGREIPLEAADDMPIRPEANLKITKVSIKDDDVSIMAESSSVVTQDVSCPEFNYYRLVAFDRDGNALATLCGSPCTGISDDNIDWKTTSYREGSQGKVRFNTPRGAIYKNAEGWGKLAKVVMMNSNSEAFKQADEAVKASEKASKEE